MFAGAVSIGEKAKMSVVQILGRMPWILCTGTHLEGRGKPDTHGDGRILDHIQKGNKRPGWCQLSQIRKGMGAGDVLSLMWN